MPRDTGFRSGRGVTRAYALRGSRKPPAFSRRGGEDYPARRPGAKIGENARGGKIMRHSRAEQGRMGERYRNTPRPFRANQIPLATPRFGENFKPRIPNYGGEGFAGGEPTGRYDWEREHWV